jgi:diguanylate cyclase (GGDEF)-like protein
MPTPDPTAPARTVHAVTAWLVCVLAAAVGTLAHYLLAGNEPVAVAAGIGVAAVIGAVGMVALTVRDDADHEPTAMLEPTSPPVDPLTGLITEEGLDRLVSSLVATSVPYSVAICDIDQLSDYNERYGSAVGNHALRFLAEVMDTTFRPSDVIARSTDNEFVAVLAGVSAIETGAACERVREALAIRLYDGTNIPHFRTSFGVADTTGDARFHDIAHAARFALMQAKAAGGNRVAIAGEAIILNTPTTT